VIDSTGTFPDGTGFAQGPPVPGSGTSMQPRPQEFSMSHNTLARLFAAAVVTAAACGTVQAQQAAPATPPVAQATDTTITAKVKAALLEDKRLSALQIDVSTSEGVVVLKGNVPSADSAQQVTQVASAVPGVKSIRSELKVAG